MTGPGPRGMVADMMVYGVVSVLCAERLAECTEPIHRCIIYVQERQVPVAQGGVSVALRKAAP